MFVKETKGRRYYVCGECKKPYSFKVGRYIRPGMENYCRHCAPSSYPRLPKKNVNA